MPIKRQLCAHGLKVFGMGDVSDFLYENFFNSILINSVIYVFDIGLKVHSIVLLNIFNKMYLHLLKMHLDML